MSVFSGPTFETASLIATNLIVNQTVNITVMNNTYILVAAYLSNATKSNVSITYQTIPKMYNFSYLDTLGYIPTYK